MITDPVYFSHTPDAIEVRPLPTGEADIFIRKNIRIEEITDEHMDGEETSVSTTSVPVATEAFMRTPYIPDLSEIQSNFDSWFDAASIWSPAIPVTPTADERLTALESAFISMMMGGTTDV